MLARKISRGSWIVDRGSWLGVVMLVVLLLVGGAAWVNGNGGKVDEGEVAVSQDGLFGEIEVERPEYKPGEIIVKFKRGVSDALEEQLLIGTDVGMLRLSGTLDSLNSKYKVRKIEPLIRDFKAGRQRIENLLNKDRTLLTKREKHLVRRLGRAPKGAEVPELDRIYIIALEEGQSALRAAEEYNEDKDVEYAELNYIVSIVSTEPNDPNFSVQWPLVNTGQMYPASGDYRDPPGTADCDIDANEAWDISTGSSDIIVAVVDTGVDYTHRDLQNNMWTDSYGLYGYDFVHDDNDPMDDHGHGTHCAGIISADTNNGLDVAGVSWNAKVMALKFLNKYGSGWTSDAVLAMSYAVDNGADITSNSWGYGTTPLQSVEDAIDYAYSQGVITVAAAGNDNSSVPRYPADHNHVVSVAATDSNDDKASFSNYGEWVDIAAPGVDILSLRAAGTDMYGDGDHFHPDGDANAKMYIASGTSMACPHVSGACALLLSVNPYMSADDANDILTDACSVDPIVDGICRSDGRLNVYKALLAAVPSAGYISLDKEDYNCDCNIGIALAECDLKGEGPVDVNIVASGGDWETVSLTETDTNSGIFAGSISTSDGTVDTNDGTLQVSDGETITVTYEDANDGTGNPAEANDTAEVDCVAPTIIGDVNVTVLGQDITVTFETSEYSLGRVHYGTDCNQTDTINRDFGTEHSIKLTEVSPWTDYYFMVSASDAAGNQVADDNDGNCYIFSTDGPNDFNVPGDFNTIQEAVDNSWDGGTVTVATGTYNENINFKGRAITLRSTDPNDWAVVESTVITDVNYSGPTVEFDQGEDANSIITGFTIEYLGPRHILTGAINILDFSSPTIRRCVIKSQGNGILVPLLRGRGCSPMIIDNEVSVKNVGISIPLTSTTARIENNWIHDCNVGIAVGLGCAEGLKIRNNVVTGSRLKGIIFGGWASSGKAVNNTIAGNNIGVWVEKDEGVEGEGSVENCIVWGNLDDLADCNATYSCISDVNDANGVGNITDDPCFVHVFDFVDITTSEGSTTTIIVADGDLYDVSDVVEYGNDGLVRTVTDVNTATDIVSFSPGLDSNSEPNILVYNWGAGETDLDEDYHLVGKGSPCIDAGDPNADADDQMDIDAEPRLADGDGNGNLFVDMGADEYMRVYNLDAWLGYVEIQDAIDDANNGDTIEVTEDTYYERINFEGKAITVRSVDPNDWDVVANTVIDASGVGYVVTFDSGEGPNSILTGLTVKNGAWAGVFFSNYPSDADGTVTNCIISDCPLGIGIECYSSATIRNNKIHSNTWLGIGCVGLKAPVIENNWIWGATYSGGGWYGSGIVFEDFGGGGIVRNNTITGNERGIWNYDGTAPAISNCIIWDNNDADLVGCSATYSCIEDGNSGTGNTSSNPCFVDADSNDFHLKWNSPCIEAGDPNGTYTGEVDIDFEARVIDDYVDMGGDEFNGYVDVADSNIAVSGTPSGDYTDTHASDDVYESIQEITSKGPPASRYTYLEHKWTFDVTGGDSVGFCVEAYHTQNNEGDDFEFYYSTDDSDYTYMLTVTKTSDDDTYQSFELPGDTSGTLYIKVIDADQTAGNSKKDTIYVDHMRIVCE